MNNLAEVPPGVPRMNCSLQGHG